MAVVGCDNANVATMDQVRNCSDLRVDSAKIEQPPAQTQHAGGLTGTIGHRCCAADQPAQGELGVILGDGDGDGDGDAIRAFDAASKAYR